MIPPNKEYLFSADDYGQTEVWNLKSRVKQRAFEFNTRWQVPMCTSDSKFVFLSKEDSVLVQWNLVDNKEEKIYNFRGIVS